MCPTKAELEERVASLEDTLGEARDLIGEVLGEDIQEDEED